MNDHNDAPEASVVCAVYSPVFLLPIVLPRVSRVLCQDASRSFVWVKKCGSFRKDTCPRSGMLEMKRPYVSGLATETPTKLRQVSIIKKYERATKGSGGMNSIREGFDKTRS